MQMLASTSGRPSLGGLPPVCTPGHARCRPARRHALVAYSQYRLVLYTKLECPLCDGLKDKVQGLIDRAAFMPSALSGALLEVRNISTNAAWQDAMQLSVPVLKVLVDNADGQLHEVELPQPPPRITADRLERHLTEALQHATVQGT